MIKVALDNKAVKEVQKAIGGGSDGTTVIANPELSGDEPNLEGLEVDGIKYKVPQGGGSDYVAGNGIDITKEGVINADLKAIRLEATSGDHLELTNEQCESLKIGDTVTFKANPWTSSRPETSYTVSRKDTDLMFLTHLSTDYSVQVEIYKKVDGVWEYNQDSSDELTMHLAKDIPVVVLQGTSGNIRLRDFLSIMQKGSCYISDEVADRVAIFSGASDFEGEPIQSLSTTVYQGKYYTVTFEPVAPEDPKGEPTFNYTITEVSVSGGSLGYTLNIKNIGTETLDITLFQYDNGVLDIVDETITNDSEFHTFNNVYAIQIQGYENNDYEFAYLTGFMIGELNIKTTGLEDYGSSLLLATNVELTVNVKLI